MMSPSRLDSVVPAVAERFRQVPSSKRREAVRVACERAVAAAGLTEPEVVEALEVLRGTATADASLRTRLERVAAGLDDEYLQHHEDGGALQNQQALDYFSKARAMSALAFAVTNDETQLDEAIYEAISALDEPGELVRLVQAALG